MSRVLKGLVCVAALFTAGCGDIEFEDVEVEVGFQGEARRNPLLAAETLLEELGRDVESAIVLEPPGDHVGVLIVTADQLARSQDLEDAVYAWVERGGQLVVTVFGMERPAPIDALLLERCDLFGRFNVSVPPSVLGRAASDAADLSDGDTAAYGLDDEEWSSDTRSSKGRDAFEGLEVESSRVPRLDISESVRSVGRFGVKRWVDAITFEQGAGRVTLLSSGSLLWNGAIALSDNAQFLWTLVEPAASQRVVFVHGRDETIWQLLVERAPQFVAAALLLIALALWRLSGRFGPTEFEPPPVRHAFSDHIVATGRFLWRHAEPTALVGPLRRRVLRSIARRHALGAVDAKSVVAALRESDPHAAERVGQILLGPVDRDPTDFVALAAALYQLERAND